MNPTKTRKPPSSFPSSSSSSLPLWSRASTRLGLGRKTSSRPVISAPIGPIKNSRGPDFSRSDTLIMVDGISDCAYSNLPPVESKETMASRTSTRLSKPTARTRRISAGFSTIPSTASPTVAKSNVTAASGIQAPLTKKSANQLRKTSIAAPPRPAMHSGLKTSSTMSLLPGVSYNRPHDENTPPGLDTPKQSSKTGQGGRGRLPTSRTMTTLQDLENEASRPSPRSASSFIVSRSDQLDSPALTSKTASVSSYSNLQPPHHAQTRGSPRLSPYPNPGLDYQLISEPQPSEYWSGRFMSLHDKYSSQSLHQRAPYRPVITPERQTSHPLLPMSVQKNTTAVARATQLAHSTTTSALLDLPQMTKPPPPPPPARDEDIQDRRIFKHLEALCTTNDARASLSQWQQTYARRRNRPSLLPQGGTMSDKGFVSKWFGSHAPKSGRRSLSAWRDGGTNPRSEKTISISRPIEAHDFRATMT